MQRTELETLGEFGLIEKLTSSIKHYHKETLKGVGDDAAVIAADQSVYQVMSSDMLVEGIHFDLSYFPLKHLGYKSVAVNISDIAAMNAIPKQITVSLAISNRFSLEAIEELYSGIRLACENYSVDLVGGDTTSSRAGLVVSITALGSVTKEKVTYRHGAKENEIICVSGDLGGAYVGLQVLEQEKQAFLANPNIQPQLEGKDYIIQRQLKPEARMDLVYEFLELGIVPSAMIDISDGLASEILHICKNSSCGAVIFEDKLPIDRLTYDTAISFDLNPTTVALNGGEDYELLFILSQTDFEKVSKHQSIFPIGYILNKEDNAVLKTKDEQIIPIQAQGWKHF